MSTGSGVFTMAEAMAHQNNLRKHPDFDPSFSQLVDLSNVTKIELSHGIWCCSLKLPYSHQILAGRSSCLATLHMGWQGCSRFFVIMPVKKEFRFFAIWTLHWTGFWPNHRRAESAFVGAFMIRYKNCTRAFESWLELPSRAR